MARMERPSDHFEHASSGCRIGLGRNGWLDGWRCSRLAQVAHDEARRCMFRDIASALNRHRPADFDLHLRLSASTMLGLPDFKLGGCLKKVIAFAALFEEEGHGPGDGKLASTVGDLGEGNRGTLPKIRASGDSSAGRGRRAGWPCSVAGSGKRTQDEIQRGAPRGGRLTVSASRDRLWRDGIR